MRVQRFQRLGEPSGYRVLMPLSKVIDLTMSDDALSDVKRRNVCSSIRRLCKLDGVRPEDAPAAASGPILLRR